VPKTDKKNKLLKARPRANILESAKLIHPGHENFNLVCNIMMGIKKAIDSTLDIALLEITEKEYNIRCKYEIAPYRTNPKDNIKACTFYDYAPQIFASIRKTFGIKKDTYSNSLGPDNILGYMFNANFQPLAELCSSGKSGSFFYYTSDGKFVLKTISRTEFKFLKRILRFYH
jgi:1-phosphatidylinositol-4-phosphate 5-kinase